MAVKAKKSVQDFETAINEAAPYYIIFGYCCTLKKLMNELDKLKCFDFHTSHPARALNPPTKAMRTLYELLDIACPLCIG